MKSLKNTVIINVMSMDGTALKILKKLEDGRASLKNIADELGLSEGTVRNRVHSMMSEGVLEVKGLVDLEALDGYEMVQIGIKLSTMDLVGKGEEISKLNSVLNVLVVTGRFDLMVTVLIKKGKTLADFYLQEMNTVSEIQSVETFVVYKEFNTKIPSSAIEVES